MPSVLSRLLSREPEIQRSPYMFSHNGFPHPYDLYPPTSMAGSPVEASAGNFEEAVRTIGSRSSLVGAAISARSLAMSQLYFAFRNKRDPSRLFGTAALDSLENPGPDTTREDLLLKVEPDVAFDGTVYWRRLTDGRIRRLRPDWVSLLIYSNERPGQDEAHLATDAALLGYVYKPGGRHSKHKPQMLTTSEVMHFAPEPHPTANFIGQAWVTAVVREIAADMQATDHVSKFFENAATANMVATAPPAVTTQEAFNAWVDAFDGAHRGAQNAWKNIYVQAGTDVKVIGSSLGDLAMSDLQGGFETRVSAKSRVPATVLLIREGLSGSALNAGNYAQTRRMWADSWFAPYAQAFCSSVSRIVQVPSDAELTFDRSRVLMLQEDEKDAADIRQTDAITIRQLVDAGYDADAATEYVRNNGDLRRLIGKHSGLPSVQVQQATAAAEATRTRELGDLIVRASQRPPVTINLPESRHDVHVDGPTVHLPEMSPVVNVQPSDVVVRAETAPAVYVTNVVEPTPIDVQVTNHVEPAPVDVQVSNNVSPTPVNVQLATPAMRHRVKRDKSGNITEVLEERA